MIFSEDMYELYQGDSKTCAMDIFNEIVADKTVRIIIRDKKAADSLRVNISQMKRRLAKVQDDLGFSEFKDSRVISFKLVDKEKYIYAIYMTEKQEYKTYEIISITPNEDSEIPS